MEQKKFVDDVKYYCNLLNMVKDEVAKRIVGNEEMLHYILVALITEGHILLEGVPGLAKTFTVRTFSEVLGLDFKRIQFTPDMLPSDIIGGLVYNQKNNSFEVNKGPIFANFILADEINRAPAKVQSALLEAMQERNVTIGGQTLQLPRPFLVMATANPIEQEGTYNLPEAQLDRFLLKLKVDYLSKEEEIEILNRIADKKEIPVEKIMQAEDLLKVQELVTKIKVEEKVKEYIVDIILATRNPEKYGLTSLKDYIEWGASPRASIALYQVAQANALLDNRTFVIADDVKEAAIFVLRHRILLSFYAEADNKTVEDIVEEILGVIKTP